MRSALARGCVTCVTAASVLLSLPAVAFAASAHHALATQVSVTFTDKTVSVYPGQIAQPGPAMITIWNKGQVVHALTIKGPGISSAQTQRIPAGRTIQVHLNLLAGAYALTVSAQAGKSSVRYLVVHTNIVGPPVNAPPVTHTPTNAVSNGGMDCNL
jgi:hypothetical protein